MTRLVFALLLAFGFLAAPIASAQTTRSYIAYRGTYASGTNYAKGDMVSDGTGAKYLSLSSSNAGNTPSTSPLYWLPLSSGGSGSGGSSITTQTNGTNNLSQTNLNHTNSTANAAGFSVTASNPSAGVVVDEVGVSNATTALTALGGTAPTGTGAIVRATSPTFTGTPVAPTPTAGTSTTQIATTAFVASAITAQNLTNNTYTVGNSAISANSCTSTTTLTVTGAVAGSPVSYAPSALIGTVTGWASGALAIDYAVTATSTVSVRACNLSASSITPGASVTFTFAALNHGVL